jgi:hypothetical protein
MTSHSDDILDRIGFRRSDILPFLAKAGIAVGDAAFTPHEHRSWPAWKQRLAVADYLTDREVAAAIADIDLSTPGWLPDDEQAVLCHWETIVRRACRSGSLKAVGTDWNGDGSPSAWEVRLPDLAAWCASRNPPIPYPLPGNPTATLPTTDAGLREALTATEQKLNLARARIAELERECEELRDKTEKGAALPAWTFHETRLFRLLPAWIEAAQASGIWEKQATLIPDMMQKHGLTEAEAKALDAITRPDSLRKKSPQP